ncbi:hypothetical protein Dalk_4321 [Desulfatibacillum aliphaticivorans]|uniref:SD-repeat containing protein B domain-containing protein n=2 Tax=Desulfatibacillum aliphaticivorans TaxID=218208 RepID=B8FMG3_DESAL|nr:hypothetical protein Dalk_4321 [Desulfatibacillum aliphaticivorans]
MGCPKNIFQAAWRLMLLTTAVTLLALRPSSASAHESPEENPPVYERGEASPVIDHPRDFKGVPVEWTYHKTADDAHPNGLEQQQLWLLNRARSNPSQEGYFLANLDDSDVSYDTNYFGVDFDLMQEQFDALPAQPPGAFDNRLYSAAYAHSLYMISINDQTHTGQLTRIDASGFVWNRVGMSVYAYARSGIHCHAGFNIDWGYGEGGMQVPPGHRYNTMSIKTSYDNFIAGDMYNIGIAVVPHNNSLPNVGPLVVTENFARAYTDPADHYNRFLVGTLWEDLNGNDYYDSGEGIGGNVTVTPVGGNYYAVTPPSGGFAVPILASGRYDVTFSGGGLAFPVTRTVRVADLSVLLDMPVSEDSDKDLLFDSYEREHFGALGVSNGTGDQDQDGLNDADEYRYLTDPKVKDSEGDLMEDGWEVTYGLDPMYDDSQENPDGDSLTNLEEFLSGTDPTVYTAPWPGDTDQDGVLTLKDALFCLQVQAGARGVGNFPLYDMDGDGRTGVEEAIIILKKLAGLP